MDASIAAEVVTTLGGLATTSKALFELIRGARERVKDRDTANQLDSALTEIRSIDTRLFETQEKVTSLNRAIIKLEEENSQLRRQEADLREEIRRNDQWAVERKKYHLKQVGKAVVLVSDDLPNIYFCPNCIETSHKALPLQDFSMPQIASHICGICKTKFKCRA